MAPLGGSADGRPQGVWLTAAADSGPCPRGWQAPPFHPLARSLDPCGPDPDQVCGRCVWKRAPVGAGEPGRGGAQRVLPGPHCSLGVHQGHCAGAVAAARTAFETAFRSAGHRHDFCWANAAVGAEIIEQPDPTATEACSALPGSPRSRVDHWRGWRRPSRASRGQGGPFAVVRSCEFTEQPQAAGELEVGFGPGREGRPLHAEIGCRCGCSWRPGLASGYLGQHRPSRAQSVGQKGIAYASAPRPPGRKKLIGALMGAIDGN